MRISTRTRYGTRLMLELGIHFEAGPVFLKDIAKAEDISEKYLSQIIIPLKALGLVNSFRGAKGGYVLTKAPKEITLGKIVNILEGGFELLSCVNNPGACQRVSICVTRDVWNLLGKTIANTLDLITLEDLVKAYKEKKEIAFIYNI